MMIGKTAAGIAACTAITSLNVVVSGIQCATANINAGKNIGIVREETRIQRTGTDSSVQILWFKTHLY